MKDILRKILAQRGLKSVDELSKDERQTFNDWQMVLSKDELTIDDIKIFCQNQIDVIENKWADYTLDECKKRELVPYHTVYKTLLRAMDSPKSAKEALEKNLIQMLEQ